MILGTAGHIDHGKTALVRALTGVDTDRLPEEKRRGITIDLGFAPLQLDGVGTLGIVDVPGHEAFVRTMVAGATGIDLALIVVAADEGVMPQTREHLAILALLGVNSGVVALTKRDLVDDEWLALAEEDVRATLTDGPFATVPIVPVSSTTGEGLDALRAALATAARGIPSRADGDLFRLPVDRAFTVKGTGTVVTGTVWSGSLTRDATLRLYPGGDAVRVRGLQAHGRAVDAVHAGDRAAIALAGVDLERVGRGAMLVQGEAWRPTRVLRADVALLDDAPRALGPRTRVRLHLGTSDVSARLVIGPGPLAAGEHRSARVVLDEPVVARAGDRFVLRSASPAATLGGGVVVDPMAPPRARPWPDGPRTSRALLERALDEAGSSGVRIAELPVRLGASPAASAEILRTVDAWTVGGHLLARPARAKLALDALATLDHYHLSQPLDPGAPLQWLRSQLGAADDIAAAVLAELAAAGEIDVDQGVVRRAGFAPRLSDGQRRLADSLLEMLSRAGAEPPTLDELGPLVGARGDDLAGVARLLAREGAVVAVEPARYYAAAAVDRLVSLLRAGMGDGADYGPADLRELLGVSRKFLIPFLEYCDRTGVTIRDAAGRRRGAAR
ncbi:MAG TPA: selenocysteine-specific translation elongation factor [Gemmatimonadaceae bacterium]